MKTTELMNELSFTELKSVYNQLENIGLDNDQIREFISEYCQYDSNDFEIDGRYRFIHESDIDQIQQDELSGDPYILGCFNDWFIADNTDLSIDIVKALQKAYQYDAIGKHILDNGYLSDIQSEYAKVDGYGHHFSHYDGSECELSINGVTYYLFIIG